MSIQISTDKSTQMEVGKMRYYSVGTQWDSDRLKELVELNNENNQIHDIYGALPFSPIGHGRTPTVVPPVTNEEAKEHIGLTQRMGITFNYLLNGSFVPKNLKKDTFRTEVLKYIEYLVKEFGIRFVTIAVPELIELVNDYFPELQVKVSTIYNILSKEDLLNLKGLKFQKVTLGNDAPRNFSKLKELLAYGQKSQIELEMMISETCIYQCPTRQQHYRKLTLKDVDFSVDWYMNNCTLSRLFNPVELFKACWVRPEDLAVYTELGLQNFKISGRTKPFEWTKKCLSAYFAGEHSGNLWEILGTCPPDYEENAENLFYIENSALENFLDDHPKECLDLDCKECRYCHNTAIRLFREGNFRIHPICGSYDIVDDQFLCNLGPYTEKIFKSVKSNKGK